ncbi:3-hydroxyacyl-CoA dehydrogenase NAD-binding domain-containing protein [Paraburkholderia madseniana]|uniref:3-hydroxyacyl-CoA dehydrogenase NAD-binding domain-containing protein n=1 Tax=Paraburkholderia madseniana TaxID=2599607 RepID=A0AAP5BJ49_9BURK|nr:MULTISPECIES: 3-hydroxyacyl-CoA dehydrogenase NAD-binding domain-containing protein [Paraburkholderia]MCX4149659.1 3-hydroxyacyl-CoA dehydrogenase NAD-binding domain-containing protein [Paraburkholderia madseniana]MDN7152595.1 3-hydroxyacyl-CoA dehydrogenase NAD-binding domain-containing protein [Paraburkholderia sp. WS6]MDQ6411477.1 3-hydroxyacyl-CoA dehydrogenase NAD-binding domain-containing protein [Paraburkholderia madseniana]
MKTIDFEIDADGIARVGIDVPGRTINVFVPELLADLASVVEAIRTRDDIRGAILTSAKASGFIAGADLKDFATAHDRRVSAQAARDMTLHASQIFRSLETSGKPVAAAINGLALGGGYELCLACHYRVLVDDPKAVVGLPEVTVGLLPGAGGTQRLPRLIGIERAIPLLLDGRHVGPVDALRMGLVDKVVARDLVYATAREWVLAHPAACQPWDVKGFKVPGGAGALAPHAAKTFGLGVAAQRAATRDNYPAPGAIQSCVYEGTQLPLDAALRVEASYFGSLLAGSVARNLMRTLFVNKLAADKGVGRPGLPDEKVVKLGVLGAGMMGSGITYAAAVSGIDVVLLDASQAAAEQGKARCAALLAKEVAKGRRSEQAASDVLARITPSDAFASVADCDLVVEAVFENREIKADVIRKAEAVLPKSAVFASNTSTLRITGLAQHSMRPGQLIGIHFFSPVERMQLVEVIVGRDTSESTLARALGFIKQLRKTPIVVNDSPGFYTSRIFCAFVDEGMAMLAQGVAPALIENAARQAGMATGPLAVTDEVSLELQKQVIDQAIADGLPDRCLRQHAAPVVEKLTSMGRLGRKAGMGFYDYPQGAKKHLWNGLSELYPLLERQPSVEEVKRRLLYIQALEAARCIEEGVLTDAANADIGAVMGLGFPTWTGGTLSLIETIGLSTFVAECDGFALQFGERFQPSEWLRRRANANEPFFAQPA